MRGVCPVGKVGGILPSPWGEGAGMRGSYFSAGGAIGSDVLPGASLRLSIIGSGVVPPHP